MPTSKTPEERFREMVKTNEGWEQFEDILKDVTVKCSIQPLATDKERQILLKTNTVIDDLFGGGLSAGQTVEIYGEYASGKSQTIVTLVVEAADKGTVVYIDAEDTFSRNRIIQVAKERGKDVNKISNNILLFSPDNWEEQLAVASQLPDPLPSKLQLIVLDSLMALFRSTPEFAGRQNLGKRQELIRWHLRQLKRKAKAEGCIVVYTNQVYDDPVANPFLPDWASQQAAGGHSVYHLGDYRIFLRKAMGNIRIARLVDSVDTPPSERIFRINEKGIDDLPQEMMEEAKKRIEKYEKSQTDAKLSKAKKKETEKTVENTENNEKTSTVNETEPPEEETPV